MPWEASRQWPSHWRAWAANQKVKENNFWALAPLISLWDVAEGGPWLKHHSSYGLHRHYSSCFPSLSLFFPPFLLISASCPCLPGLGVSCPPHSGYVSWIRPLFLMVSQILHTFVNSVCAKLLQSCPTLWDPMDCCLPGVHQAPLSMEFFRQEYWSGLPLPPPGYLLHPGIEPVSLTFPAWQEDSLPLTPPGKPFCK